MSELPERNETVLQLLIADMDVPEMRRHDVDWLARNLGIRNASHRNFTEAMRVIQAMRRHPSRFDFISRN
jgi:hypothetical protein